MRRLPLVLIALAAAPRAALACTFDAPGWFTLDASSDDTVAPGPPGALTSTRVTRGVGAVCNENGTSSSSSCGDLGFLHFTFPAAVDDRSPTHDPNVPVQEGVGYAIRLVEGTPPDELTFGDELRGAFADADGSAGLQILWHDRGLDEQEAFDLTLGVTAVDLAGNRSAEVYFEISDPGREDPDGVVACPQPDDEAEPIEEGRASAAGLCATSPVVGVWALLVATVAIGWRRR